MVRYSVTGLESKMPGSFSLYFVNYRSWQAEILHKHAEGNGPPNDFVGARVIKLRYFSDISSSPSP